jgi:hypothetical protein
LIARAAPVHVALRSGATAGALERIVAAARTGSAAIGDARTPAVTGAATVARARSAAIGDTRSAAIA